MSVLNGSCLTLTREEGAPTRPSALGLGDAFVTLLRRGAKVGILTPGLAVYKEVLKGIYLAILGLYLT